MNPENNKEDVHEETIRAILNGDETPTKRKEQPSSCSPCSSSSSPSSSCMIKKQKKANIDHSIKDDPILLMRSFKYSKHSLRLSSSSIAAMAGFNPYTNLAKLFMDLVYQGYVGQMLLRHDAKLLGMELMSEQQILLQLAQKAGKDVLGAVKQFMDVSKGKVKVKNVQDANVLKKVIVAKVQKSSNLSIGERNVLQEATRYNINTGFGKDHEKDALDMYEKQCGWEVTCRNEAIKCWKFQLDDHGKAMPMDIPQSSYWKGMAIDPTIAEIYEKGHEKKDPKPFFSIVGVADGIRDELYHVGSTTSDEKDWALRHVVVECKHRMEKAFIPPPIYDQIQLVIYCMMYGTSEGEMVQVVRNQVSPQDDNDTNRKQDDVTTKVTTNSTTTTNITISRISLHEKDSMKHYQNWHNTILPRLTSFVHAVYNVRADDDKRYRMIQASAEASLGHGDGSKWWQILLDECPWLKDCDIALFRNNHNNHNNNRNDKNKSTLE